MVQQITPLSTPHGQTYALTWATCRSSHRSLLLNHPPHLQDHQATTSGGIPDASSTVLAHTDRAAAISIEVNRIHSSTVNPLRVPLPPLHEVTAQGAAGEVVHRHAAVKQQSDSRPTISADMDALGDPVYKQYSSTAVQQYKNSVSRSVM